MNRSKHAKKRTRDSKGRFISKKKPDEKDKKDKNKEENDDKIIFNDDAKTIKEKKKNKNFELTDEIANTIILPTTNKKYKKK